ncbi:hypothetical protein [Alkalihalobacterium elongatum]|uniref:hypothetical protein n=1 Tax=Alkalihalobacterium elongatum TaxID=2675466 RepID=UPI001C1F34D2|nr:hypothetical protein [Alkalihalobacterium elongatum]
MKGRDRVRERQIRRMKERKKSVSRTNSKQFGKFDGRTRAAYQLRNNLVDTAIKREKP